MTLRRTFLSAAALGAGAVGLYLLRQQSLRHGATDDELYARLPGDDLVPHADLVSTRAISIAAPAQQVWPWIAQLGQGKAGFYSYEALENLVGCEIRNADEIVNEWQGIRVGGKVRLTPEFGLHVAEVVTDQALVLEGVPDSQTGAMENSPFEFSWTFALLPDGEGCRLVCRERYGFAKPWARLVVEPMSLTSYLMSERMLRGIRDRAESATVPASGRSLV